MQGGRDLVTSAFRYLHSSLDDPSIQRPGQIFSTAGLLNLPTPPPKSVTPPPRLCLLHLLPLQRLPMLFQLLPAASKGGESATFGG
jgi:hypothetical protein